MKGPLFRNDEGEQFYYSPSTGRIIQLPEQTLENKLITENFRFRFGYDKSRIKRILSSNLDTLILEASQNCSMRCNYCIYSGDYKEERPHQPVEMDIDVAKKAVRYFLDHSNETKPLRPISFYGVNLC